MSTTIRTTAAALGVAALLGGGVAVTQAFAAAPAATDAEVARRPGERVEQVELEGREPHLGAVDDELATALGLAAVGGQGAAQRLGPGAGFGDVEALVLEVGTQVRTDLRFVVDDEHASGHLWSFLGACPPA